MRTPRALHRRDPETQVRVAPRLDVEGVEMLPGVVLLRVRLVVGVGARDLHEQTVDGENTSVEGLAVRGVETIRELDTRIFVTPGEGERGTEHVVERPDGVILVLEHGGLCHAVHVHDVQVVCAWILKKAGGMTVSGNAGDTHAREDVHRRGSGTRDIPR